MAPPSYSEGVSDLPQVPIRDDAIRLGQLLKLANLVEDGAMARAVVEAGEVSVDGQVETRRGAKIRPGQRVEYAGEEVEVVSE